MLELRIVDPNGVIPVENGIAREKLINIAREGNLASKCGYAPVIETHEKYRRLGRYTLIDGHHRRDAAVKAQVGFPVAIIKVGYGSVKDTADDLRNFQEIGQEEYDEWLEMSSNMIERALKSYWCTPTKELAIKKGFKI